MRRLTSAPGPEADLSAFLDRRDPEMIAGDAEPFVDRAGGWLELIAGVRNLYPITRDCMGFHLWGLAGFGQQGDRMEAAVTTGPIGASDGKGAVIAPLAMGGAVWLRASGALTERLGGWLNSTENACRAAMGHIDDIEVWSARAEAVMATLSGRTPPALRQALTDWPLVSAPMAETLTGASRAVVQRNLAWMKEKGLIREVAGQGRFCMWRASI